jgi:uncharacterized protein (TIGR02118 family)
VGIKLFTFGRRRAGLSTEEFHAYWRDEHARLLADEPTLRRHVRRFELNHRLPEDYGRDRFRPAEAGPGYDGVAVLWFDSMDAFQAMLAEPAHAAVAADGAEFREDAQLLVFTHDPDVIVGGRDRSTAGAKMLCILRRHPDYEQPAFHEHWLHHHGGLFQDVAELNEPLLGYDQNHGLDLPGAAFDGVTEQWFASYDTFLGSLQVEAVERLVNPDVASFLDPTSLEFVMAGPPTVVIDDGDEGR